MRVKYDRDSDSVTITLSDRRIRESDEVAPGMIVDHADDGSVVRFEILDASDRVDETEIKLETSA